MPVDARNRLDRLNGRGERISKRLDAVIVSMTARCLPPRRGLKRAGWPIWTRKHLIEARSIAAATGSKIV
jgi:hypothetical protein